MKLNQQSPEKPVRDSGTILSVHSVFLTIQGEGPFAGQRAVFIRLAGCNLQCPMCDTDYTAGRQSRHVSWIIGETLMHARKIDNHLIVITGGEPFRQPIGLLVRTLLALSFRVQLETNGTLYSSELPYADPRLTIVCSPKSGAVNPRLAPHIAAYKYVARAGQINPEDGLPTHALEHPAGNGLARPHEGFAGEIYLQPADEQDAALNTQNLAAVVSACHHYGHRLCLQIHKLIGVP